MISGISRIWITFEMNSQNTKAIGGSNCNAGGASRFQLSHSNVHAAITRKNPIEPTWTVIHIANRSSFVTFAAASSLMLRNGRRCFIPASTGGGSGKAVDEVVLMAD